MIQLHSRVLALMAASLVCLASAFSAAAQSDFYVTMPDVQANGGNMVTVPVSLTNAEGIFSMQIEVFLPDGVDVVGFASTDRTANATTCTIAANDQYTTDNVRYRRILINNIMPSDGSAIEAGQGEICTITFQLPEGEGTYPISLKNIQFINPPTYVLNYIDDVEAVIIAADYYFTFPDDIQASIGDTIVVPLDLHNVGGIYSIQIDLMLADGVEFVDVALGERVNSEFFQFGSEDKYTDDGLRYRRTIFANLMNTESTVNGNEGTVLYYTLRIRPNHDQAVYPLRVMNIQYFNPPTYELHYIADAEGAINVSPNYLIGDVNHDGKLTVADVTLLIGYVLNHDHDNLCLTCADLNGDGNIVVGDVTALISKILSNN